ncbi:MAG TPA: SwmB domain-containing protein, partial [Abditibacteriaceae bacterium]
KHTEIETILNVPPTVLMGSGSDKTINENGVYTTSATFIDFGASSWTATINYGDGSPIETVQLGGGEDGNGPFPTTSLSHVYGDNGTYTVTVEVTDNQDGGKGVATATVRVNNLDPEVYLVTSSATLFHGGNAFLGRANATQAHTATISDPGSDDLRFTWSHELKNGLAFSNRTEFDRTTYFNNGTAAGDLPFTDALPSSPGNFPFHVAKDGALVRFAEPGIYRVTVTATDDDFGRWAPSTGTSSQSLAYLVTDNRNCTNQYGFWQRQYEGGNNQDIDNTRLQRYLDLINWASSLFGEAVPVTTFAQAVNILKPGGPDVGDKSPDNHKGKAVQEIFVAWLNWASGGIAWAEVLPNGENLYHALARAEALVLNPLSDFTAYKEAQSVAAYARRSDPGQADCIERMFNVSLDPASISSAPLETKIFTSTHQHPATAAKITSARILVNSKVSGVAGLYARYDSLTNRLYLLDDAGKSWLGGFTPGTNRTITNSQGSLNCATTTVQRFGNQLVVQWSLSAANKWQNTTQKVFLHVTEQSGLTDGWDEMGKWTITASTGAALPTTTPSTVALSATAAVAGSSEVTLTFTGALDGVQAAEASRYSVTINGAPVAIQSVTALQAVVKLRLATSINKGDALVVRWNGLVDASQRSLADDQATIISP